MTLDVHEVVDAPAPAAPAEIEHSEAPNDYRSDLADAFRAATGRAPSSDAADEAEVADQAEVADDPAPPSSTSAPPDADQAAPDRPLDARLQALAPEVVDEALDLIDLHRRDPQRAAAYIALKSGMYGEVPAPLMQQADRWFAESRAYSSAERKIGEFASAKVGERPRHPDFEAVKVRMGELIQAGKAKGLDEAYRLAGGKVAQPPAKRAPSRAGSYHDTLRETMRAAKRRAPR